jgi:hypothetical protein
VIRLGLRLAISGGREAVIRLVVLTAAVGLGVGLLLIALSGINAVNGQNDRYAWFLTGNPGVPSGFANPIRSPARGPRRRSRAARPPVRCGGCSATTCSTGRSSTASTSP